MTARKLVIVGAGKRVVETALPALARARGAIDLSGIFARAPREIEAAGARHAVRPLANLAPEAFAGTDLVYLAVGKANVPAALRSLARFDLSRVDLLIETPVLLLKHYRHISLLRRFRDVWVSEDCSELPWLDTVRGYVGSGALGEVRSAVFDRSAYAYHGVALAKALLDRDRVASGRRVNLARPIAHRTLRLTNDRRALVIEPRDYAVGRFVLLGTKGSLSDAPIDGGAGALLEAMAEGERCLGFRIGPLETRLDDDEAALAAGDPPRASATARMAAMKRVGFLRLLRRIAAGRGAYPLEQALEDMVVDYALEKVGIWVSTPFTNIRSAPARFLYGAMSRLARR